MRGGAHGANVLFFECSRPKSVTKAREARANARRQYCEKKNFLASFCTVQKGIYINIYISARGRNTAMRMVRICSLCEGSRMIYATEERRRANVRENSTVRGKGMLLSVNFSCTENYI